MKVILVMVVSADGKTTRWDTSGTYSWTSPEDRDYFTKIIKNHRALIMGRKTYLAAKSGMQLSEDRLRIILTSRPLDYKAEAITGELEFTDRKPADLLEDLKKRGFEEILLLGGEQTNAGFLEQGLIDELWLTLEPKIFGKGNGLVSPHELDISLTLLNVQKLNAEGTLLLKYSVL